MAGEGGGTMRFMLLSMPRTGSSMVAAMLGTHPDIACLPAILSEREWEIYSADTDVDVPWEMTRQLRQLKPEWDDAGRRLDELDDFLAAVDRLNVGRAAWGFKHHLGPKGNARTERLLRLDWPVVLLERHNLLAAYSSNKIVALTGQGAAKAGEELLHAKAEFDADEFEKFVRRRRGIYRFWDGQVRANGRPVLELDYNEARTLAGMDRIATFLGQLPGRFGAWPTAKRNSDDVLDRFANRPAVERYLAEHDLLSWGWEAAGPAEDEAAPPPDRGMHDAEAAPARKEIAALPGDASRGEGARLFAEREHLAAYRAWSNAKTAADPHLAVGGLWDEIGAVQFDFLRERGLEPRHSLLDIGCGTLRGGRHFIRYLDRGCYTGFDLADRSIEWAKALVDGEALSGKQPTLLVTTGELTFDFLEERPFDFILAQSVFTHLPADRIEECFAHIHRVMGTGSRFFFTLTRRDRDAPGGGVNIFDHRFETIAAIARRHGIRCTRLEGYRHPRGQRMGEARLDGEAAAAARL